MGDILRNYCGSSVCSTLFLYNGIYLIVRNVKFVKFGLFSYSVFYYQNKIMKHFLQRNKNTSLNYYRFSNHFLALCLFTEESGKVCVAKETTVGLSKIHSCIHQENIFHFYFSWKNLKKSMLCTRIKVLLVYQLV